MSQELRAPYLNNIILKSQRGRRNIYERIPRSYPGVLVQIVNSSPTRTPVSNVYVSCGEFASTSLLNLHVFKRLKPNDCLVNDGKQLAANEIVSFVYTNSRTYDLVVSHVDC
ncbi:hypothetical protein H6P81_008037 [Aristolochia fimbriata]|uniref:Uncharacterized protein n=1 Tax=Aristolochia fimbriata TaxID=158543 RepID=A0AAV7F6E8_ARIFI|nr:hypothetical protein H6P81_008037 [Aristolochia fimbriata]